MLLLGSQEEHRADSGGMTQHTVTQQIIALDAEWIGVDRD